VWISRQVQTLVGVQYGVLDLLWVTSFEALPEVHVCLLLLWCLQVRPGLMREQRSVVHIKKCRYLENSGCVGMCINMCKVGQLPGPAVSCLACQAHAANSCAVSSWSTYSADSSPMFLVGSSLLWQQDLLLLPLLA
jgi:hypothetical protein